MGWLWMLQVTEPSCITGGLQHNAEHILIMKCYWSWVKGRIERCGDSLWMKDGDNTEILAEESGLVAFGDPIQEIILVSYTFVSGDNTCRGYLCNCRARMLHVSGITL